MGLNLYPDSILENWGEDMRNSVLERGPYCLLERNERETLVLKLLDEYLYGALLDSDYVQKIDSHNGLERRAKAAGHVKIILESLRRDNREYDEKFIEFGHDMIEVWKYYFERKRSGSFYKTGVVSEK